MKDQHKATKIIATFANAEYGLEAIVAEITFGYSVVLKDTDADQIVGFAKVFATEAKALKHAQALAAQA